MSEEKPRESTREEIQAEYLKYAAAMVIYWLNEDRRPTALEKMNGLVFSLLVMIDGESSMPSCKVIPHSTQESQAYRKHDGENWYPQGVDIAGNLHEIWHNFEPKGR